ncbi:hypothetical protein J7T55_008971, partial [Diaporthe amygdali]|uniref:uncharacterized protein n=1 Tax=Phomopsis amygdali TaxID=1214568 RepID=UPI0022FE827F
WAKARVLLREVTQASRSCNTYSSPADRPALLRDCDRVRREEPWDTDRVRLRSGNLLFASCPAAPRLSAAVLADIHFNIPPHGLALSRASGHAISSDAEAQNEAAASDIRDLHDLITHHVELETTPSAAREPHGRKVPDISFCYGENTHAPFVAEIGYSQKSQDLASLARSYILKSGGAIRTVLTVDLEHQERTQRKRKDGNADGQKPRAASSVCLYRLGKRVLWDAVFRDEEGVEQAGELDLCLSDFVPEGSERRIGRQALETTPITVPFHQLAELLRKGERRQVAHDKTPEPEGNRRAQNRARKRKQVTFDWDLPPSPEHDTESPEMSPDGQQSSKRRRLARASGRCSASLAQRPAGPAETWILRGVRGTAQTTEGRGRFIAATDMVDSGIRQSIAFEIIGGKRYVLSN